MFAQLLAVALVAHAVQGAPKPNDCTEFCDDVVGHVGHGGYKSHSSWGSYSSYGSGRMGRSGLGNSGARLEDFGETPTSYQDEKNYVTNDGRGKLHYEEGQTVTGNGYSKHYKSSYHYGTNANHQVPGAKVVTTAEFNQELSGISERIRQFMGNFALGSGMHFNVETLKDFQNKASLFSNEINNACNQYSVGSANYQRLREFQNNFQKQVAERAQQIQAQIHSSSSLTYEASGTSHVGSSYQPEVVKPAPIYAPRPDNTAAIKEVNSRIDSISNEINVFYTQFQQVETNAQFAANFKNNVERITQKLTELCRNPVPTEALAARINSLKTQFKMHVETIKSSMTALENSTIEEERRVADHLARIEHESKNNENYLNHARSHTARILSQIEEKKSQYLKTELSLQQSLNEKNQELQRYENQQNDYNEQRRKLEADKIALQRQKEEFELQQNLIQVSLESSEQLLNQLNVQVQQPAPLVVQPSRPAPIVQPAPSVQAGEQYRIKGESKYEANYESRVTGSGSSGGSYNHGAAGGSYVQQRQTLPPHTDSVAAVTKLNQDLSRLLDDVNNFSTYSMRLTASNSASIMAEAESVHNTLKQRLTDLCSNSQRYQNEQLHNSAEELKANFETMFLEFMQQARSFGHSASSGYATSGGYSQGSSWDSHQQQSVKHSPSISDLQIEHSKSTEIEISGRPNSQRAITYGGQAVDCVEGQVGQPCIVGRSKREVGGN